MSKKYPHGYTRANRKWSAYKRDAAQKWVCSNCKIEVLSKIRVCPQCEKLMKRRNSKSIKSIGAIFWPIAGLVWVGFYFALYILEYIKT